MTGKVTILGAGISGRGAAELALKQGYEVFVSDGGHLSTERVEYWKKLNVDFEMGQHTLEKIFASDLIIKSPGIPDHVDVIQQAVLQGILVIDELEFAARFTDKPILLITGTNGKTTTTLLTAHLLQEAGMNAQAVGNVGISFASAVVENQADVWVLEASSFQLDGMYNLKCEACALLNITKDHLDRYGSMEAYVESKHKVERLLKEKGLYVFNADDPNCLPQHNPSVIKSVSGTHNETYDSWLSDEKVFIKEGDKIREITRIEISLSGRHNMINAMTACWLARSVGADWDSILRGLSTYRNREHRMEFYKELDGIHFYNDSKATNLDAVKFAIESFNRPIIWIAGGVDKGNDYSEVSDLVHEKVKGLICLGVDNEKLKNAFDPAVLTQVIETKDMFEAVKLAHAMSSTGDVVLLSPACASFDLFKNYEHRGDEFKQAVNRLEEELKTSEK